MCRKIQIRAVYLYVLLFIIALNFCVVYPSVGGENKGGLYLVGLGPGDPDLATVKAIRLIKKADLIFTLGGDICDRFSCYLKDKDVRILPHKLFTRYYVRKKRKGTKGDQSGDVKADKKRQALFTDVHQAVSQGKLVVFIDNGDPLIFGPWVWMLQEFADLNPRVIPGVSSFNAGLAALKRDGTWAPYTHSVILTTDRPGRWDSIEKLAKNRCSMIIFTHRTRISNIIRKLRKEYPSKTPVAIVINAGHKDREEVIKGTLANIGREVGKRKLPMKHIIFVGDFITFDF